jgi:hypothetical protein
MADARTGKHRLDDGHPTIVSLAAGACLWEKSVTMPTIPNIQWRTNAPKHLHIATDIAFTAAYAVGGSTELRNQINKNQVVLIVFGDGSKMAFWGWLNSFASGEVLDTQPTASCTIIASNQNNNGEEMKPAYLAAPPEPTYNPIFRTYGYINAKRLELYQRIREGKIDPNTFKNLRSGAETLALYDSFDISEVRQKLRDYFEV